MVRFASVASGVLQWVMRSNQPSTVASLAPAGPLVGQRQVNTSSEFDRVRSPACLACTRSVGGTRDTGRVQTDGGAGDDSLLRWLSDVGAGRGSAVGLAVHPQVGVALAFADRTTSRPAARAASVAGALAAVEHALRPRWVWWSAATTAAPLLAADLRLATCWDLVAVHRLLAGGHADDAGAVWAAARGLDPATAPRTGQLDLLTPVPLDDASGDSPGPAGQAGPVDGSGHLRAEWVDGGWSRSPERLAQWAALALQVQTRQLALLERRGAVDAVTGDPVSTARSESAAALLCAELAHDGLPLDVPELERLISAAVGPRPRDPVHEATLRRQRDDEVLRLAGEAEGVRTDLRNPAQVRALLARTGLDVPDTRSWRLEPWREQVPLVAALLSWRRTDRIATTYGYSWLDRFVAADHRLRGPWSSTDGAAGRMTAGAGLHNLPAELRPGVAAAPGHVLVRADLGQIEPRVLAAVSADPALAAATQDDDLYAPVAARLRVERPVAKIAVLAAMYGQTSGAAGEALKGLDSAYPVAMRYLRQASDAGRAGRDVFTHGGRRIPMWATATGLEPAAESALVAARGRFARNAVVQGAAAELFKAWAVTVRSQGQPLDAEVVLCLHDELLVHVPKDGADAVVSLLHEALHRVGAAWAPSSGVRFVADVRVVRRWSEAKE